MVRTTRNSAFPLIMQAYPSAAFTSGVFFDHWADACHFRERSVSSESVGIPANQPGIRFVPKINWLGSTSMGSIGTPAQGSLSKKR